MPEPPIWVIRICVVVAFAAAAFAFSPIGLRPWFPVLISLAVASAIFVLENRLRHAPSPSLLGGAIGGLLGALASLLVSSVVFRTSSPEPFKSFLEYGSLLAFGYLGVMLGARKFAELDGLMTVSGTRAGASSFPAEGPHADGKLLDTSVLIDGRIADICEAHFLDGPLLVPQFVLHELQAIADSPDSLRRQRGRRGLEVLQRMQKLPHLEVRIVEDVPGQTGDVDRKLVELALRFRSKIVTNDFNLNKVASVQGISILNVNLLANALRPAVLPGEGMRVFILREGKEVNQGVAYLEDGTMVVVDGARRLINKTVEILVTSVHQTPAGKMIFGRLDASQASMPGQASVEPSSGLKQAVGGRSERPIRPIFPDSPKD